MKTFRIFAAAVLSMVCVAMPAKAQEEGDEQKYDYTFNRHLFIQGHVGGQYTLGEVGFSNLLSPTAQLGVGYQFTPVFAARLSVNAWQSKAGINGKWLPESANGDDLYWKWNYVAPSIDAMFDLTNLCGGFNPDRKIAAGLFAGIGANIAFGNDEAKSVNDQLPSFYRADADPSETSLSYLWEGSKAFLNFRFGGNVDYRFNDNWSAGIELQANLVGDHYNSKKADNADWYFNAMAGVTYRFGKPADRKPAEKMIPVSDAADYAPACEPVEKIVEKPVEVVVEKVSKELYEEVYFKINQSQYTATERYKVRKMIDFLNENPESNILITGSADKKTGNAEYNQKLSEQRAETVRKALVDAGIDESRIQVDALGGTDTYKGDENQLNRSCICVIK